MKLNNKGITLVEIVISVALISIVLIFLFNLLIQVNNENADNEVRSSYLVNQSTFIKQIEEDFIEYKLKNGEECTASDVSKTNATAAVYLPNIKDNNIDLDYNSSANNIKCLKFTYDDDSNAFLFLYKKTDTTNINEYITILSYYRGDFRQSVELEDFDWDSNKLDVVVNDSVPYKAYSLPIIGPDSNDYSINLSYAN